MTSRRGFVLSVTALGLVLVFALLASLCIGREWYGPAVVVRAVLATFGLAEPLGGSLQTILELRIWRGLTAAGVGSSLGLSGALCQGLFRNGLAAPSLIGVTGGASLGAALAILVVGGYAPGLVMQGDLRIGTLLIPVCGFLGALTVTALVVLLAGGRGRLSTPTLLLFGIAANMCVAGAFAAIQSLMLRDWEVSRAIMAWTFGTLEDRSSLHALTVWLAFAGSAALVPFIAVELDLLQPGEADAQSLGVRVQRVKLLSLTAAALSAAAAVAVAGQIAFIGLVVPHFVRVLSGPQHRTLLPLSALGGAVFLLVTDLVQRSVFGEGVLQPGVTMSLIGGPTFVYLLVVRRRELRTW